MGTVQITARIDAGLKRAIEEYCGSRLVMNHFIEEALYDRLEELEDNRAALGRIKREATRPLSEVIADLELDGWL